MKSFCKEKEIWPKLVTYSDKQRVNSGGKKIRKIIVVNKSGNQFMSPQCTQNTLFERLTYKGEHNSLLTCGCLKK